MTPKIFIGIDPGSKGAISVMDSNGLIMFISLYDSYDFANVILGLLDKYNNCSFMCTLEKVHSMPRDGVKQAFKFGENYGFVKGTLMSLKIPFQEVSPQTWKKEFSLIKQDKSESIKRCKELFPNISLLPTERCKKDSDGMAEATLICEYGRRHF